MVQAPWGAQSPASSAHSSMSAGAAGLARPSCKARARGAHVHPTPPPPPISHARGRTGSTGRHRATSGRARDVARAVVRYAVARGAHAHVVVQGGVARGALARTVMRRTVVQGAPVRTARPLALPQPASPDTQHRATHTRSCKEPLHAQPPPPGPSHAHEGSFARSVAQGVHTPQRDAAQAVQEFCRGLLHAWGGGRRALAHVRARAHLGTCGRAPGRSRAGRGSGRSPACSHTRPPRTPPRTHTRRCLGWGGEH